MNLKRILSTPIALLLFIDCYCQQTSPTKNESEYSLINSIWHAEGRQYHYGDSLRFISGNEVNYYMGELGWDFDSEYGITGDTLTIMTITMAFEVDDISGYEPDLIQRYKISKESLRLIYLANLINNEWIEADKARYELINSFKRLK